MRVAVVDPREDFSLLFGLCLELAGCDVDAYPSGQDFLDTYRPGAADVVILQWGMPLMPGWEVEEEMLKRGWTDPVLFMGGEILNWNNPRCIPEEGPMDRTLQRIRAAAKAAGSLPG